jgi:hypothetical protein
MKLIPSSVLSKLGLMANVRPLRFEFARAVGVQDLVTSMNSGQYVGYVHMQCGNLSKILVLHYDGNCGQFMGYMPTDQKLFIDKLRKVVEEERERNGGAGGAKSAGADENENQIQQQQQRFQK